MKIRLLSVDAQRPDRRAIAKVIEEHADGIDSGTATEYTGYLLEGSPIDIEVSDNESSAFRALRKNDIDYEIIEE